METLQFNAELKHFMLLVFTFWFGVVLFIYGLHRYVKEMRERR